MPRLLIIGDDGVERAVELTARTIQIGRGPGNDVVLPDAHKGVSRTHAELRFRNGRCVLVDLQSQNGTFVNGQRIEHAEVPLGADIGVGSYRLRIERTGIAVGEDESAIQPPPSTVGFGDREVEKTGFHDLRIIRPPAAEDHDLTPRAGRSTEIVVIDRRHRRQPHRRRARGGGRGFCSAARARSRLSPICRCPTLPARRRGSRTIDAVADSRFAHHRYPASECGCGATSPAPATTAAAPGAGRPASASLPSVKVRPEGPPVARKPGETAEAWQIRTAAFETRYAYSRAALDRGDFAAAAGGFEAILREEPGYLDVPQLLVRSRAGLRDVARAVYESGLRLDAAGDWLGALQKYEQAGQIHPEVKGLPDAIKRVREKLSAAGEAALVRARRFDEAGRWTDALKEYEKAVQWLPPHDPKREMSQSRSSS